MNIRVVQKKERVYADGRCPLLSGSHKTTKVSYITTGIAVLPDQWDSQRQRITDDCPDTLVWNAQIAQKLSEYDKKIKRLEALEIKVNFDTLFESYGRRLVIKVEDGCNLLFRHVFMKSIYPGAGGQFCAVFYILQR